MTKTCYYDDGRLNMKLERPSSLSEVIVKDYSK